MELESGKIYRVIPFTEGRGYPVLEIKGSATVYVSLATTKPLDEHGDPDFTQMVDVTSETTEGMNTLIGLIRYIAVVFDTGSSVKESGVVTSVKSDGRF